MIDHLCPEAVLVTPSLSAWAPYLSYDVEHALCGAHVIRELRAVAEAAAARTTQTGSQSWAGKLVHLLEDLNTCVITARDAGRDRLDPDLLGAKTTQLEAILTLAHEQNPDPPGGWPSAARRPKAVNLLLRIEAHRGDYLRFTTDFAVPFTNNQAERDLRGVRLRENVSGSLRTVPGARTFAAIRSYLATAARHGLHALTEAPRV